MITWAAHPDPQAPGRFTLVRSSPHTPPTVELDISGPEDVVKAMARKYNQDYARKQARSAASHAREGRIIAGFYTDKDAA
jgi:cell division septation protein DedD